MKTRRGGALRLMCPMREKRMQGALAALGTLLLSLTACACAAATGRAETLDFSPREAVHNVPVARADVPLWDRRRSEVCSERLGLPF